MKTKAALRAITATFIVSLSFATPIASQAASSVNLIATYGTIKNDTGYLGLVGYPFNAGEYSYAWDAIGETFSLSSPNAAQICGEGWNSRQVLCDPAPDSNVRGVFSQNNTISGFTSGLASDNQNFAFVVIDLGAKRTFDSYEVYQMHQSDGQVTNSQLFASSASGDTWPVETDSSWTNVTGGPIAFGADQTLVDTKYINTDVTTFNFAPVKARYIKLYFQNDGTYGNEGYLEVAGVKLFQTETAKVAGKKLASTGSIFDAAYLLSSLLLIASGFALKVRSRRRP